MTTNIPYQVDRHELIFAKVVNASAVKFNFATNELLRGKKITGITFHPSSYIQKTPLGETLVATAGSMQQCFLTLKSTQGVEKQNKIPLYALAAGVTPGGTYEKMLPLKNVEVDWEQSYITVATASVFNANEVFMLSVWFDDAGVAGCQ